MQPAFSPFTHPYLERFVPEPLLRRGPFDLLWWQWLAIPLAIAVAVVAARLLGYATRRLLGRLTRRTSTRWDELLVARLSAPITVLWAVGVIALLQPLVSLPAPAAARVRELLRTLGELVVFWAALRAIDLGFQAFSARHGAARSFAHGLVPILRKTAKIAVGAVAVIAVLTDLGYPVTSLLAGLGLGGLALALAAQKTVENVFGSVSISVDQPFQVGDFVKIEGGVQGTVEALGLRSTRVRTLERTIVTIPNGKLADQRIETFTPRDACRLFLVLGIRRETLAAELRAAVSGLETVLRATPKVTAGSVSVRLVALSPASLDVEVAAMVATADWTEFQTIRQELLLRMLEAIERAGTQLAYPTQRVELARDGEGRSSR